VRDVEAAVRRFKTDLHNCVGYIQDPKLLKESIRALYQKHVQEDIVSDICQSIPVDRRDSTVLFVGFMGYLSTSVSYHG